MISVANPAASMEVGSYSLGDYSYGVAVEGGYAYVANGANGLQILAVTNPAAPVWIGSYNTPGDARHVAVAEGKAYVADGFSGLQIISISNPALCCFWGASTLMASPLTSRLRTAGPTLRMLRPGFRSSRLPTRRFRCGLVATTRVARANGVALAQNRICIADAEKGLQVFCSIANAQQMFRVDGAAGISFTVVVSTPSLTAPAVWSAVFSTNPASGTFEFTDLDVAGRRIYRAHQP